MVSRGGDKKPLDRVLRGQRTPFHHENKHLKDANGVKKGRPVKKALLA